MAKTAFAVASHPDDIEFGMAGTLVLLRRAGYETHYMNIANGCCGSTTMAAAATAATRRDEARAAAEVLGATWHEPVVDDLAVFYDRETTSRLCAVMREVAPEILLVHSPVDYMEDHQNAARLAVTAAFCRGMPNFPTIPPRDTITHDITIYHANPAGNRDPLRRLVRAGLYVDIEPVMEKKRAALACHASQRAWLDESQKVDSYIDAMAEQAREVGRMSGRYAHAEGWRRHYHLGFCAEGADPLHEALKGSSVVDALYEEQLVAWTVGVSDGAR